MTGAGMVRAHLATIPHSSLEVQHLLAVSSGTALPASTRKVQVLTNNTSGTVTNLVVLRLGHLIVSTVRKRPGGGGARKEHAADAATRVKAQRPLSLVPLSLLRTPTSTRSLAIWWSTSMRPRMVAPSLVTVMSPSGEMRILSRPRGPSDDLIMLVTERAARMCDCT